MGVMEDEGLAGVDKIKTLLLELDSEVKDLRVNDECVEVIREGLSDIATSNVGVIKAVESLPADIDYTLTLDGLNLAISSQGEGISEGLSFLARVSSTIPDGSYPLAFVSAFFGAVIAALAAFFINYFYNRRVNRENERAHFAIAAIELVNEFERVSVGYWSVDKAAENHIEMKLSEVKIKSVHKVLNSILKEFNTGLIGRGGCLAWFKTRICKNLVSDSKVKDRKKIDDFVSDIFDLATGSDFETDKHLADFSVVNGLSNKCSSVKSVLLKYSHKV